jgi:hypothetical protein
MHTGRWPAAAKGQNICSVCAASRVFHVPTFDHYARHSRQRPIIIPRRYRDRSKLRDCDVVALKVDDIASNGRAVDSGNRPAKEKGQPVGFELTEQIREAVDDYRIATGKKQANFNGA